MKEKYVDVKLEVLELEEDMIITSGGGGVNSCFSVGCASYSNGVINEVSCGTHCWGVNPPDCGSQHCQPVCYSWGC